MKFKILSVIISAASIFQLGCAYAKDSSLMTPAQIQNDIKVSKHIEQLRQQHKISDADLKWISPLIVRCDDAMISRGLLKGASYIVKNDVKDKSGKVIVDGYVGMIKDARIFSMSQERLANQTCQEVNYKQLANGHVQAVSAEEATLTGYYCNPN